MSQRPPAHRNARPYYSSRGHSITGQRRGGAVIYLTVRDTIVGRHETEAPPDAAELEHARDQGVFVDLRRRVRSCGGREKAQEREDGPCGCSAAEPLCVERELGLVPGCVEDGGDCNLMCWM